MATDLGPMPLRDAQGEALRLWCDRLDQWRLSAHNALTHFEKEEDKS